MILLHDIIEILRVADNDGCLVKLVVALDRCGIGPTPVDGNLLWEPLGAYSLA
jgi:hypothetical protein